MSIATLEKLFKRDLQKLRKEIEAYQHEDRIWAVEKNIANSAGNLALHLVGNLNMYVGNVLGSTGYVRNREAEFALKNVPRTELLQKIDDTITMVENTLNNMDVKMLPEEFPILVWEEKTATEYMLTHLTTHLAYHLGQINYHRRLLDA